MGPQRDVRGQRPARRQLQGCAGCARRLPRRPPGAVQAFKATEKRENTSYDNGNYNGTSFAWGNLPYSTWQEAHISNSDFSRANIAYSSFFGATWGGTNTFWQTCINDVDWRYVGSVPYSGPTRGRPCNSVDTWD